MNYNSLILKIVLALCVTLLTACDADVTIIVPDEQGNNTEQPSDKDNEEESDDVDEGEDKKESDEGVEGAEYPEPDYTIAPWDGLMATDIGEDSVGSDKDFYHELNTFTNLVVVQYSGDKATVTSTNSNIITHIEGAHVVLDMATKDISGVEIVAIGKTDDGSLKIYSNNKYKLSLYGVDICSQRGPAINSQAKKRVYIALAPGTTNRLTDCATYSNDIYTLEGVIDEDRKGALFAEGHIIISGSGALVVAGKQRHGIVTDGYYYQRHGATVAVTEAAKNAIHVKGDDEDGIGAHICGGAITARVASEAGKGIKCDMDVIIDGGVIDIVTSGNAYYDSEERDTSSAAGIKSDCNIVINGGILSLSSSGTGGKGLNADQKIEFNGGDTTISTTGNRYAYSSQLTSSPKGVKADGDITVNDGRINVSVTGRSDGCEGIESKSSMLFNGGETIVTAYDDGINASTAITINGGRIYAHGTNNDGMDSNGNITMNGGLVIGIGSTSPETGIDVDRSDMWRINGGTMIGFGGSMMASPSSQSTQNMVIYNGLSATADTTITLLDGSNTPLLSFDYPFSRSGATLLISSPEIARSVTYTLSSGGTLENPTDSWQGWHTGGVWSGGSTLTTFTPSSTITTIGSSGGGPGGGGPGGGGGGRPR